MTKQAKDTSKKHPLKIGNPFDIEASKFDAWTSKPTLMLKHQDSHQEKSSENLNPQLTTEVQQFDAQKHVH